MRIFIFVAFTGLSMAKAQPQPQSVTTSELKEACKQEGKSGKELLECIRQKLEEAKKGSLNLTPKND